MTQRHPLVVLNPTQLINDAVEASKNGETVVHELSKKETAGSFEVIDSTQAGFQIDSDWMPLSANEGTTQRTNYSATSKYQFENQSQISTVATPHEKSRVASAKNPSSDTPPTTQTSNTDDTAPPKEPTAEVNSNEGEKENTEESSKQEEKLETYETSSDRANLGTEILTFLETGEKIPLNLVISVLKEALHRVPKSSGWILENFPNHIEQLEMFESEIVDLQGKRAAEMLVTKSKCS